MRGLLLIPFVAGFFEIACAQVASAPKVPAASGWSGIPADAVFETGDAWTSGGLRFRLFGVQACLRGTTFTNEHGVKRDCGEASLAMLVSLIRDLRPQCYIAATEPTSKTNLVFCLAQPQTGAGKGSRIDLGTALISTGYSFASVSADLKPVHMPYFVAQIVAKNARAGLWAYADLPEPNAIILQAIKRGQPTVVIPSPLSPSPR